MAEAASPSGTRFKDENFKIGHSTLDFLVWQTLDLTLSPQFFITTVVTVVGWQTRGIYGSSTVWMSWVVESLDPATHYKNIVIGFGELTDKRLLNKTEGKNDGFFLVLLFTKQL